MPTFEDIERAWLTTPEGGVRDDRSVFMSATGEVTNGGYAHTMVYGLVFREKHERCMVCDERFLVTQTYCKNGHNPVHAYTVVITVKALSYQAVIELALQKIKAYRRN